MYKYSDLYRLSKLNDVIAAGSVVAVEGERDFEGQMVLSGPETAIEVVGEQIHGYVKGVPSRQGGRLQAMIEDYRDSILRGTAKLKRHDTRSVILLGKWHLVMFDTDPRFEAYVIHLVSDNGDVVSERYVSEIFDWDDPVSEDGRGFGMTLDGDGKNDVATACLEAEAFVELDGKRFVTPAGRYMIDAVLWYSVEAGCLPLIYCPIENMSGQGVSVDSPYRSGSERLRNAGDGAKPAYTAVGTLKGQSVSGSMHRPDEMTLSEIISSTDAVGYWFQMSGTPQPTSQFMVAQNPIQMGGEILKRLEEPSSDPNALGNAYASDWKNDSCGDTKFRFLAVGPHPVLEDGPI